MQWDRVHEHDESAWRSSPVGVLNAVKSARQRGKAEARRLPAVPSYTGLESTQLTDRDITVCCFTCQGNPGTYKGWNHRSSGLSMLAITVARLEGERPLISASFADAPLSANRRRGVYGRYIGRYTVIDRGAVQM
jgi:hypothetical protein